MHRSAKFTLIGIIVIVFFVVLILLLERFISSSTSVQEDCHLFNVSKTCYSSDHDPFRNYGSKTPYIPVEENFTKSYDLEGCVPKVFYLFSRHATRYPDEEYIEYINAHLPSLQERIIAAFENGTAKLCEKDISKLKAWSPAMTTDDENRLSATGAAEAEALGKRLRERFPEILGMRYSPERFLIEYTSRSRTKNTAKNFIKGLFTEQDYERVNLKGKANDKLLQFHKDCKKMMKKCEEPFFDVKEVEKFENGTLMRKVINNVSKRTGINVTKEEMMHMHVACTFGVALNLSDAWCVAFSKDDLRVLEYASDLEDYYKRSYGNSVNYKQACPLVQYVTQLFKSYEKTRNNQVVLHFSHAGAMTRFFSALGLFRDKSKLTADNICAMKNRKWRTSNVVPFNANLVLVLYDCEGSLKFIALHNEKPITIDGCDNECTLEAFYNHYKTQVESCDLTEICDICPIKYAQ